MKVLLLKEKETFECNESYGARLIEQGKAILLPPEEAKPAPAQKKAEPQPEAEQQPKVDQPEKKPEKNKGKKG